MNGAIGNPLTYSTPLITGRRHRILRETRKLIAEKGLDGFGVRELCQRAGVAQRTLYNAFSSKERVAALAIGEAFDEIRMHVNYKTAADTIEGMIDRAIGINSRNLKARNYVTAVTTIYFSNAMPKDVWEILKRIGTAGMIELLESLKGKGQVEDWVIIDEVALNFSNMTFAIINEWTNEHLSDADYLRRIVEALLMLLIAVTRGEARDTALRYQHELRETGLIPRFPMPSSPGIPGNRALAAE